MKSLPYKLPGYYIKEGYLLLELKKPTKNYKLIKIIQQLILMLIKL